MENGLYSLHVKTLDGHFGKGSGVVIFRDGRILGGDAFLFYVGTYSVDGTTLKGELQVEQHTQSKDVAPLFSGRPVSIGFSGKIDATESTIGGAALFGKQSIRFTATLRRMADAD
jgi:hypothetical protein